MKKRSANQVIKKTAAAILATTFIASTSYSIYAASLREAWNNAAGSPTAETVLANGNSVRPNVYADSAAWESFKTQWDTIRKNYEQIALTPGKNETELNFGWYSRTVETPAVRLTDSKGNPTGQTFFGTQGTTAMNVPEENNSVDLYAGKVTMTGVASDTTYYYQYFLDGGWSDTYTYTSKDSGNFSFLYVGDPQLGASTGQTETENNTFINKKEYFARNDAFNWNATLNTAVKANPNLSFIFSAGDQINQTSQDKPADVLQQQIEYAGFLNPSVLRSLPISTVIGNHDNKSPNYQNHFNNPNPYKEEIGASVAGNDYYFSYGEALFVSINTNNYNCQTHKDLIDKALASHPDAKWKVLMFHQDIYGSGADHSDSDGMILRTQLTPIIDAAGFDAVLQGHDHTYSRSYQISADSNTYKAFSDTKDPNFQLENASCYNLVTNENDEHKVIDPKGTVYFEANSSTGSKYYQLIETQQNYIAARSQSWRPTYSVIDIDDVSLTVKTFDAATGEELVADGGIKTAYTIVKSADKANLEEKITEAEKLLQNSNVYTQESIANLQKILDKAKLILDNPEAGSVDVASAYTSISEAISALKEIPKAGSNETGDTNGADDTKGQEGIQASYSNSVTQTTAVTSPKTGDTKNSFLLVLCLSLSAVSGSVLVGMYLMEKKKRKAEIDE